MTQDSGSVELLFVEQLSALSFFKPCCCECWMFIAENSLVLRAWLADMVSERMLKCGRRLNIILLALEQYTCHVECFTATERRHFDMRATIRITRSQVSVAPSNETTTMYLSKRLFSQQCLSLYYRDWLICMWGILGKTGYISFQKSTK